MAQSKHQRPLILVTNDDGISARGIHALIDFLLPFGDVVCVAPDGPRSAQSMALTVGNPLRVTRHDDWHGAKMYSVNGTPVDCVKLSMHHILPRRPDLVASGINHGSNSSVNVIYSGTMGAVTEGCILGIDSVGFSLTTHNPDADFSGCRDAVEKIVRLTLEHGLPEGVCLNVNIPAGVTPRGIRTTVGCKGEWSEEYRLHEDPVNGDYYTLEGDFVNLEPDNENTDEWALAHGYVSVTPTSVDRTSPHVPAWLPRR